MWVEVWTLLLSITLALANYPVFDVNTQMRNLLLPSDARISSVIYRLRATDSDRDYPLSFAATDYGSYVVRIEDLPCNKNSSYCEGNVLLERSITAGQIFEFRITVNDASGHTTTLPVVIRVTSARTDFQRIFPHVPGVIMIPENTPVGTELEYVRVKKNPTGTKPANLELWGSENFEFQQSVKKDSTTGVISLKYPLDFESKSMYKLSVFATGMFVDVAVDSRNIAGFQVAVIVTDVQDTPPVWNAIDPITKINGNLTQGDVILRVTARDGDKGSPRDIKYGLVPDENPLTVFFTIDTMTGDIRLARSIKELSKVTRTHQPILLTVVAEEIATSNPPPMSSTTTVALLLQYSANTPPYFESKRYVSRIDENSLQGTSLIFGDNYMTSVKDNDMGKHGVFSLGLENNNGTFEISPNVGERETHFVITVRDNTMLDFEKYRELNFQIVARELNPEEEPLSSTVRVIVHIDDVNDNPPIFKSKNYSVQIPENITSGVHLLTVEATDLDSGDRGKIKYTGIYGPKNNSLIISPDTGVVTVTTNNHGFDREETKAYQFYIEARDLNGNGNKAVVPFCVILLDVNDNAPKFERSIMEFTLSSSGKNFTQKAIIKAIDGDAEAPNNIVRYEILNGNYGNRFLINSETGELTINQNNYRNSRQTSDPVANILVRAYDMGIPTQWSNAEIKIFPSESGGRVMRFVVPGNNPDRYDLERMLSSLTGGRVIINEIIPYNSDSSILYQGRATDLTRGYSDSDKSIVTATVLYYNNAVIDIDKFQKQFLKNQTKQPTTVNDAVIVYRSESNVALWILIVIIILIILLILLLALCCCCSGCPLYGLYRRKKGNHNSVHRFRENKSIQAAESSVRKEAWSADPSYRPWNFSRRNPERVLLVEQTRRNQQQQPPNIIFTREVGTIQRNPSDDLILEDMDGTEYRLLDPSRLSVNRTRQDADSDSMRHHEYERGSDKIQDMYDEDKKPPSRDQMFIRDGNAEILRLITRGRNMEDEPRLNEPERPFTVQNGTIEEEVDAGKNVIMRRFIEDQRNTANNNTDEVEDKNNNIDEKDSQSEILRRLMDVHETGGGLRTADVNRLTMIQRDLLLTRFLFEEQRRVFNRSTTVEDTQSLPGVVAMATQTDVDTGTQTDKVYFSRRKVKSDNDDSYSDNDDVSYSYKRFHSGRKRSCRHRSIAENNVQKTSTSRCKIKTPILEESENLISNSNHSVSDMPDKKVYGATKSSLLRQNLNRMKLESEKKQTSSNYLRVNSFQRSRSKSEHDIHETQKEKMKLLEISPISHINIPNQNTNNIVIKEVRYDDKRSRSSIGTYSAFFLGAENIEKNGLEESDANHSDNDDVKMHVVNKNDEEIIEAKEKKNKTAEKSNKSILNDPISTKKVPRYMEWYKKKKESIDQKKKDDNQKMIKRTTEVNKPKPIKSTTIKKGNVSTTTKTGKNNLNTNKVKESKTENLTMKNEGKPDVVIDKSLTTLSDDKQILSENSQKLVQIVEMAQQKCQTPQYDPEMITKIVHENIMRLEDDIDSGIAMSMMIPSTQPLKKKTQQLIEKKSVFTIAYDDMKTKQIRLDTASPP